MTNKPKSKSRLLEAVHETARDLHRLGFIDKRKMRKYDELLTKERGFEMGACVPYVVTYTETVIKEKVVYAATAEDAKEQVEADCEVGFGEVLSVELQQ